MKKTIHQKRINSLFLSYPIKLISKDSSKFPIGLKALDDCPDILFILGNETIFNNFSISIVGTRNSSETGNQIAFEFAKNLAKENIIVVSGLANGIDSHSHLGAISSGKTIAILPYGFMHIPSKKINLLQEILSSGGTIISEYFPDTPPQKFLFLKRNRLIATISRGLIVVEAPEKSGALNTAQIAINYNKPLFVVPWNINSFRGIGSNNLFQKGAHILTNIDQLLAFFNLTNSKDFQKSNKQDKQKIEVYPHNMPIQLKKLYNFIKLNYSVSKEQIYLQFPKESISNLNSQLILMELNNWIIKENEFYSPK